MLGRELVHVEVTSLAPWSVLLPALPLRVGPLQVTEHRRIVAAITPRRNVSAPEDCFRGDQIGRLATLAQ